MKQTKMTTEDEILVNINMATQALARVFKQPLTRETLTTTCLTLLLQLRTSKFKHLTGAMKKAVLIQTMLTLAERISTDEDSTQRQNMEALVISMIPGLVEDFYSLRKPSCFSCRK